MAGLQTATTFKRRWSRLTGRWAHGRSPTPDTSLSLATSAPASSHACCTTRASMAGWTGARLSAARLIPWL
eukprot:1296775-Pyramimonas_sp.AAC.1